MQTLGDIKARLAERGLAPKKSLGQNFLIDHNLTERLVDESGVGAGDVVLEVGPGTGVLTERLLARGCRVIACELDRGLAELLRETFADRLVTPGGATRAHGSLELIGGDALAGKRALSAQIAAAVDAAPFTLVANLPYGAATPVLLTLMTQYPACRGAFVTIQREVADRLLASPGTADFGVITVIAALMCERCRIATLPPECFWPRPGVTSAMIGLRRRAETGRGPGEQPIADLQHLADWVQRLFTQRRKQIRGVLSRAYDAARADAALGSAGIDPGTRIDALQPAAFAKLHALLEPGSS